MRAHPSGEQPRASAWQSPRWGLAYNCSHIRHHHGTTSAGRDGLVAQTAPQLLKKSARTCLFVEMGVVLNQRYALREATCGDGLLRMEPERRGGVLPPGCWCRKQCAAHLQVPLFAREGGNHGGLAVATQAIAKHRGHHGVAVGNMSSAPLREGHYDLGTAGSPSRKRGQEEYWPPAVHHARRACSR
jgi:hypothetical protein